ncbi:MAG: hypothetical protein JW782_01325 [Candidatus Saganbacteria bacterium]|nr:hypothetical protein [Candidatus Saganbacteria bacterium]
MKKLILSVLALSVLVSSCFAMTPAVIGGIRDGLAIGLMADNPIAKNVALRFGIEANSGNQPLVAFFGGKFYLGAAGSMPLSLGLHGVAYSGNNNTDIGFGLSAIFDRAFGVKPMFMEIGVDVASKARLQFQLGYKIY